MTWNADGYWTQTQCKDIVPGDYLISSGLVIAVFDCHPHVRVFTMRPKDLEAHPRYFNKNDPVWIMTRGNMCNV
jgi:hypothetical protein